MLRPLPRWVAAVALVAILLVAGLLPYAAVLHWLPWSGDALKWVARGSTDVPTWVQWDLGSKHFVGWRPVTALSFTLDQAIGGYQPLPYRATDLAFHLLSGAALFTAYRQLTGDRSVLGFLPVLLVFAHPSTEDIVPESARRSYLIATTFGLFGAVVLCRWGKRLPGAITGALLLGLSVLANEVGYVLFPLVPWFVGYSTEDRRERMVATLPSAAVLIGAVVGRYLVLGTLGGYQRRIFAFVKGHTLMWHQNTWWEPHEIAGAAWSHTVDPISVTGASPLFDGWAEPVFGVVTALWVVWIGFVQPWRRRHDDPRAAVSLGLMAWVVGALGIVVLSQTWFWRQAYSVVIPLGMLIAYQLGPALEAVAKRQWGSLPTVVLAGLVALAMGWNGPLIVGLHLTPYTNVIEGTPLARKVDRLLTPVGDGSDVYLVAPLRATGGHLLRLWGEILARPRKVTFHLLAHLDSRSTSATARVEIVKDPDGAKLVLGGGMEIATSKALPASPKDGDTLAVNRLWKPDQETWLLALDTRDAWAVRVTRPSADLAPFDLPLEDDRTGPSSDEEGAEPDGASVSAPGVTQPD